MKTETKCRVAACAAGFALPRYADLPQMGLYLDQTVQYVNSYFRTFCGVELTSSMVSNYVKKGILSHPVRKKYARDQIASLMYIAVSKTVLSMENIDALFKMQRAHCSAGAAYDYFCDEMENCLPFVFGCTREIRDLAVDAADEKLLLRSTILAAANKMYLDCCFNALRQEEISGIPFCLIWRKNTKRPCLHKRKHGLCILYVQDQVSCSSPRLAALRYAKMKPSRSPSITHPHCRSRSWCGDP